MTDPILQEIACPNCQNPIDVREHGAHVVCDACGSRFILRGRLCPHCNNYHEQEQDFCTQFPIYTRELSAIIYVEAGTRRLTPASTQRFVLREKTV